MMKREPHFSAIPLDRLLQRFGTERRRQRMAPLYQAMLAEAYRLAQPATLLEQFSLEAVAGLAPWLPAGTRSVFLGLCTLGTGVERRVTELFKSDAASAYVLDELCLLLVSDLARQLHAQVREEAQQQGLRVGPPYRPGIGRWPMEAQRVIFDLLPAVQIGVTLDETLLMRPLKSTSLVIPVKKAVKTRQSFS